MIPTLAFFGCKGEKSDKVIYDTIGRKIKVDMCKDESRFTILRYIDNPSCTSCQLKLGEWKIYHKRLKKRFGNRVNLLFLCETKDMEEAKYLLKMYGFEDIAFVDSSMNFFKTNELNPILGKDIVFLLDSTNTILSIGNPNENPKIDSLFTNIILGHFSKKK